MMIKKNLIDGEQKKHVKKRQPFILVIKSATMFSRSSLKYSILILPLYTRSTRKGTAKMTRITY